MKLQGYEYTINKHGEAFFEDQPNRENPKFIMEHFFLQQNDDVTLPDGTRWLWSKGKFTQYEWIVD